MADVALTGRRSARGSAALCQHALLRELDAQLRAAGTPKRAASDKAYLKSDLTFYGATVPEIRRIALAYAKAHPQLTRTGLRALATAAFDTDIYELRSAVIAVVERRLSTLEDRDLPWLLDMV